jgi:Flp pilus assembly protein protease CpaA
MDGKTPNCKSPPELAVSLVTQAWDLFLGVNEMRSLTVLNRHYLIQLIATVPIASLSLKGINTNGSVQLTGS